MERNLHRYIIKRSLRPQLILIAISFVLGLALNPLMLDLQKRIINQAIGQRNFDALLWLCGAFLGAVLLNGALKYVKQNLEGYISETMLRDLRGELFNRILRFPLPHLKGTSTGQLVAMILGEVEDLGGYFGLALSTPAFHGAMLVGTLGFMVYANPWMALVSMVLFPIQIVFIRRLQRKVTAMARDRVRMVRGLSDRIQESVGGLQEIYANDTVAYESGRFRHLLQRIFKIRLGIYNLKYLIKWINNFLEKFGQFLLLLVGGWLIINHPETFNLGILVAFLQAYSQLNEPWRELINFFQLKENARVKYEQVIANFDPPGLRTEFARDDAVPERPPPLAGAYDLRQASVVLDGRTQALDHLQLTLSPRQHVALAGTAGSGKSTLALVLAKLTGLHGDDPAGRDGPGPVPARGGGARDRLRPRRRPALHRLGPGQPALRAPAPPGRGDRAPRARWAWAARTGSTCPRSRCRTGRGSSRSPWRPCAWWVSRTTSSRSACAPGSTRRGTRTWPRGSWPRGAWWRSASPASSRRRPSSSSTGTGSPPTRRSARTSSSATARMRPWRSSSSPSIRTSARCSPRSELEGPLVELGADVARDMVEIFKDIAADNELFARFSLLTASELPEYAQVRRAARPGRRPRRWRRRTATG